jgi:transcriptional regulator with PAS, ATPase and Fis domain
MALQSKLLTVTQRKEVVRVGSANPVPVDVRLICASNMPLREMVADNRFRQDLLYRVNTVEINVPPLRERVEDIPDLTSYYLKQYGRKYRKPNLTIDKPGLEKLKKYQWPGNVRELQHVIERTVIMTDSSTIIKNDLILDQKQMSHVESRNNLNLEELEKRTIEKALNKHNNNLSAAAKELGLGRTTLYRKMAKYEL